MNFTIVIPHYELHDMLKSFCLPNLYLYNDVHFSHPVVIVDNGSKKPLKVTGPHKIVRSDERLSFSAACNLGAKEAKTDYLLFLNNDVQILPGFLESLTAAFDDKTAIVGAKLLDATGRVSHIGIVFGKKRVPYHSHFGDEDDVNFKDARDVVAVTGAALAVKKDWFDKTGGFSEDFPGGNYEDVDLCLRAKKDGLKVKIALDAKAIHLGGASYNLHPDEHTELLVRRNWEILNGKWKDEPDLFFGITENTPKLPREENWGL